MNDRLKDWLLSRKGYWLGLTLATGVGLILRLDYVLSSEPAIFDRGLLAMFALLLLAPLFREMTAFGLSFKSAFEKLKSDLSIDITRQLTQMKIEMGATLAQSQSINVVGTQIVRETEKLASQALNRGGPEHDRSTQMVDGESLSDPQREVVRIGQAVEKEIWRIWHRFMKGFDKPRTAAEAVRDLGSEGILSETLSRNSWAVMTAAQLALRGERATHDYWALALAIYPSVLKGLWAIG
jgi:hypothetical protein